MEYKWFRPENVKSIPEMLEIQVKQRGESTALIYFGKRISYKILWDLSSRVASFIYRSASPTKKHIAIFMPNIPQFAFCYYGTLIARKIAVPINFLSIANELRSKPTEQIKITSEVSDQLKDSQPSIIFVADFLYPILKQITMPWTPKIVVVSPADFLPFPLNLLYGFKAKKEGKYTGPFTDDVLTFKEDVFQSTFLSSKDLNHPNLSSIAQLQYTGGTTGSPKGVMLTHKNIVSNVLQGREHLGDLLLDGNEVTLGALPFFHIYGLTVCLNTALLSLGGSVVLMPSFNPKDAIKIINKYKVTIFPGVNRMYKALTDQEELMKKSNLSSLKLCISGAGPIDKSICDKFRKLPETAIVEGYGLSETSPIVSATTPKDIDKPRASKGNLIGTILPETEIQIIDDDKKNLPAGEIGTILIHGPQVMHGYYAKPEDTSAVLSEGWFNSGDIGYVDDQGRLYFVDRAKDIIKRRGENIYASHIEKILANCPLVDEIFVIGIPDTKDGEVPIACIVLKKELGTKTEPQTKTEIMTYIKSSATSLQIPSNILFFKSFDEFKNPIGKILKRKLKEDVLKQLS